MKKVLISILTVMTLVGCRVELEEGEQADLSVTWTCIYRVGQGLSCPSKAIAKIQGKVTTVANKVLGTTENALASAIVSAGVGIGVNVLVPANISKSLDCLEKVGDGICHLVELGNKEQVTVTSSSDKNKKSQPIGPRKIFGIKTRAGKLIKKKNLKPGTYTVTASGAVLNLAESSSSSSKNSSDNSSTRFSSSLSSSYSTSSAGYVSSNGYEY